MTFVLVAVAVATVTAPALPPTPAATAADPIGRPAVPVPNRYVVALAVAPGPTRSRADAVADDHGGQVTTVYDHALQGFAVEMDERHALELARDPRVAAVYQDGVVQLADTQSPAPWDLDRIDQSNLPLDGSFTASSSGAGVHAYVIDSGIRTTHADFGGRASVGVDVVGDGLNGQDCSGHGTMVAGLLGGATYGVAKDVSLVSVRVFGCGNSATESQVIAGVDWVTANAVRPAVANASLAGAPYAPLDTAVANSIASGVTYTVAAGNSAIDACNDSPARVPGAITVGAVDQGDHQASFSNFGTCLDVFGPGVADVGPSNSSDTAAATGSGTSFASPIVAGVAALVAGESPSSTPADVAAAIGNASTQGVLSQLGAGSPNRLVHVVAPASATADRDPS